jgi:hypothetical protein
LADDRAGTRPLQRVETTATAALAVYLAAWDVHRGRLIGRCEQHTGIVPFERRVEQVMTRGPAGPAVPAVGFMGSGVAMASSG